jgi:DNA-binding NtrC family response regulator
MNTRARILVVDDEEVVRRSFERILAGTDCSVRSVGDPAQAAQLMRHEDFDVVMLDLRMPGTNGIEVLEAIKRLWPHCEVVIVTGHPTLETAKQALRLGAYDYLAKPVEPERVIHVAHGAWLHKQWALRRERRDGQEPGERFPVRAGDGAAHEPTL